MFSKWFKPLHQDGCFQVVNMIVKHLMEIYRDIVMIDMGRGEIGSMALAVRQLTTNDPNASQGTIKAIMHCADS